MGPETVVGLCVERSPEMLVALLGVLKAGGAYLPLDPDYPMARLAFMLADTGVEVVVSQSSLIERHPELAARKPVSRLVLLDTDGPAIAQQPRTHRRSPSIRRTPPMSCTRPALQARQKELWSPTPRRRMLAWSAIRTYVRTSRLMMFIYNWSPLTFDRLAI